MTLRFEKYHGLGNDFLVVDVSNENEVPIARAQRLCDRHFGVGGDGVLLVGPGRTKEARASMAVINADGSTPEMCGNGLRCVALHLSRQSGAHREEFVVDTGAGALLCEVERTGDEARVRTAIGKGTHVGSVEHTFSYDTMTFERITTGNPHAICFRDPISSELLDVIGPRVSGAIDGEANVEIATLVSPTEIQVTVWERGVGRTLACGTGAAATAIEAVRSGRSPANTPLLVRLPGGPLTLTVNDELFAHLRGPAAWVYSGETRL